MRCGVGHRCGSDPALLWLWCRPEATAPIGPLAWEPPYAEGLALEKANTHTKIMNHTLKVGLSSCVLRVMYDVIYDFFFLKKTSNSAIPRA